MSEEERGSLVKIPPEPQWRSIEGINGWIAYDAFWLQSEALKWHFLIGDPEKKEITLQYLAIEEMPTRQKDAI